MIKTTPFEMVFIIREFMYASIKRLALTCGIICALNIAGTVLCFLAIPNFNLGFSVEFAIGLTLVTLTLVSLLLTIALHNLCVQLELEYENSAGSIHELNKKVGILENKR